MYTIKRVKNLPEEKIIDLVSSNLIPNDWIEKNERYYVAYKDNQLVGIVTYERSNSTIKIENFDLEQNTAIILIKHCLNVGKLLDNTTTYRIKTNNQVIINALNSLGFKFNDENNEYILEIGGN